jgi:hypothetical protein
LPDCTSLTSSIIRSCCFVDPFGWSLLPKQTCNGLIVWFDVVLHSQCTGPKPADVAFVEQLLQQRGSSSIPHNFEATAPAYDPAAGRSRGNMPRSDLRNPQTEALLQMLGLPYNLDHAANSSGAGRAWMNRAGEYGCRTQSMCIYVEGRLKVTGLLD